YQVLEIERQKEHARDRKRRAEPPASPPDGEPDPEADHRHCGVLTARERQRERGGAPGVAAGIERQRSGDDQRDRKRLWVNVSDADAVERRVDQKEQREGGGRRPRA